MTQLTCWNDDSFLLCGTAGRGGGLWTDSVFWIRGLIYHRAAIAAHVSGALGDAAVHRGLTASTQKKASGHIIEQKAVEM